MTDNQKADSGEITYTSDDGVPENGLKMCVRLRKMLGFVTQFPQPYPDFTNERFIWNILTMPSEYHFRRHFRIWRFFRYRRISH